MGQKHTTRKYAEVTPPRQLGTIFLSPPPPPPIVVKAVSQRSLVVSYAMEPKWGANKLLLHIYFIVTLIGGGIGGYKPYIHTVESLLTLSFVETCFRKAHINLYGVCFLWAV